MLSLSLSSPTIIIIFSIFIFSLHHTTSLPSHPSLSICNNTTFNCGTITNLSYPFTGGDRPSFCGPPQFHLNCQNNVPELNISSVSYRVLQINSATHSITLARLDLWNETCTHHYINSTFDRTSYSYGLGNRKLILYYGCKPTSVFTKDPHNLFCCDSNGYKKNSYSLIGPFPLDPILIFAECDEGVEVPILEEQANRLAGNRSLLREVLMKGFNVNYSNPFDDDCLKCSGSGGQQCGFDYDDNEPICICGNELCPSSGSKWNWKLIAIGASAAGFGATVFIISILKQQQQSSLIPLNIFGERRKHVDNNVEIFMRSYNLSLPRRYSYTEVKKITNSFRDKLGQGGYGVVYKASLPDGRQVAVKVINESKGNGEEFINEVASISRTSHMNIVSLLGYSYEVNKRALIYEFMPKGSLDKFIYRSGFPDAICDFDWNTLFQIAIGIARGLEYLHQGCNSRILHLDIKPQNILLDEDFCPKISDFGLAKICQKKDSIVSMLGTRGTAGYMAPEVFSRAFGGVSYKSDVYSYGMLILEIIGGRKNYDTGTSEMYFPDWIYQDLEQGNTLLNCLTISEEENDMVRKITLVSLWCIQTNPSDRPPMNKVIEMLLGPLSSVPYPPCPFLFSSGRPSQQVSNMSSSYKSK
ncbi:unnamed protein product [Trifolium pratense]|uniref:Uncharacterized protein n=1 Tax=Trifolium pratense TaxID=57577 RepID=A0ACB0K5G1_TRIPR|nr:unnamed protein product [Trifolium pratense]